MMVIMIPQFSGRVSNVQTPASAHMGNLTPVTMEPDSELTLIFGEGSFKVLVWQSMIFVVADP